MQHTLQTLDLWFESLSTKKLLLLFLVVGLVVFGNSLFNGFVWDDEAQIVTNTSVHTLSNVLLFFQGSTFVNGANPGLVGAYYKPLLSLVFSVLYTFSSGTPLLFHLFQVLLHSTNAFLVFVLFSKFFKKQVSFLLAVVFLIHPIQVEAVSFISALQEPLFFFFGMLGLLLAAHFRPTKIFSLLLFTCMLLAMLSKETGVLFVLMVFFYFFLFARKYLKIGIVICLSVLACYLFLRFGIAGGHITSLSTVPIMRASLLERIVTIPSIVFFYLYTFFFPKDLIISQDFVVRFPVFLNFYLPLCFDILFFLAGVVVGIWVYRKKKTSLPLFFFFAVWFVIGLGMHLQLIPLDLTVAERWFYFPMIGLLGMVGVIAQQVVWSKKYRNVLFVLVALCLLVLAFRTILRNFDWRSDKTLYTHDIAYNPDDYGLEANFGTLLSSEGQDEKALYYFTKALQHAPYYWVNWYNLGVVYEKKGQLGNAKEYYKRAVALGNNATVEENYAIFYARIHEYQSAEQQAKKSLQKYPEDALLWLVIAKSAYTLGDTTTALQAAEKTYALSPSDISYYVLSQISNELPLKFDFK